MQNFAMCTPLKIRRDFGYQEAVVEINGTTNYVWHLNCDQVKKEALKFELYIKPAKEYPINGLDLHLTDYLSVALNASFNFVNLTWNANGEADPETGLYNAIKGDVYATGTAPWGTGDPLNKSVIRPITLPFVEFEPMVVLSLCKPLVLSGTNVVSIFDMTVYMYVLVCTLLISTFLRFCHEDAKICRRTFLRQLFEILLLISFQPRSSDLIKERTTAIRIVIVAMTFTGLLMRKNFKAKLNSLFTFRDHSIVENLGESLESNAAIKEIFLTSYVQMMELKQTFGTDQYNIEYQDRKDTASDRVIKPLLDNEAIFVGGYSEMSVIKNTYPFLPLEISELKSSAMHYIWPIPLNCSRFKEIYYRLHLAYDHGVHHFAKRETEANERYDNDNVMQRLEQLYENSKYYAESSFNSSPDKVIKLSLMVLIIGCSVSTLFLLHEKAKYKPLQKSKAKNQPIETEVNSDVQ